MEGCLSKPDRLLLSIHFIQMLLSLHIAFYALFVQFVTDVLVEAFSCEVIIMKIEVINILSLIWIKLILIVCFSVLVG